MKIKSLIITVLTFKSCLFFSQETVFLRPTIVTFYGLSEDDKFQNIAIQNLKKNNSLLPRFDELKVEHPKIKLSLSKLPLKPVMPFKPVKPDSTASKEEQILQ